VLLLASFPIKEVKAMSFARLLRESGILDDRQAAESDALDQLNAEAEAKRNRKKHDIVTIEDVRAAKNVRNFRHLAKELLLRDTSDIREIVTLAHGYNERTLIPRILQLRNALRDNPDSVTDSMIKNTFRASRRGKKATRSKTRHRNDWR